LNASDVLLAIIITSTMTFPAPCGGEKNWANGFDHFSHLEKIVRFQPHGDVAMAWQDAG